ncbi:helix-turn-helix transcriptional regulator [Amniculibacterium aquaticum]|uniref:helix-turn-helix transcriptional regulator n=1 Tax=Amniculibacterium aquaticum TaxID=2479858 RepID=UPI000F5AA494|nr:helix-turn-helix transcriptional regulator [Amniculibacterium aquaticum]
MMIGSKLRVLRSRNKLSQQEVADLLEVDRKTYINWENELCDIKSEFIPKIAEIFGVEISDLFKNEEKVNIIQDFKDNTFNNSVMIMLVSDKKTINEVMKILKNP